MVIMSLLSSAIEPSVNDQGSRLITQHDDMNQYYAQKYYICLVSQPAYTDLECFSRIIGYKLVSIHLY